MVTRKKIFVYIYILFCSLFAVETAADTHLSSINVDNVLGHKISGDINITTDEGESLYINDFLNTGTPLVFVLGYYQCPMLCSLVLNGLSDALTNTDLVPGEEYSIITVSIDPEEGISLSKEKKENYISKYFKNIDSNDFWTFATTNQININRITKELGFSYSYDSKIDQYAHPAIVYILTEDGIVSRQIFGINPSPNDIKLSILNAQSKDISSIFDKVLLYCYRYDPKAGNYTMIASNVMKVAGASTVFIMAVFLSFFWIRERIV